MFDIALDPLNDILYGVANGTSLYTIDQTNASATFVGNLGYSVNGLTFGSNDILYGFTSSGYTLSINTSTGVGSVLSFNGIGAYGADGVGGVAEVSEPAVLAFFGLGLMGLGFSRRAKASNA